MNSPELPISVCFVTNLLDDQLMRSVDTALRISNDICIGYDGEEKDIPAALKELSGVHCFTVTWQGYSNTKNFVTTKAKHDWILSLDGDEVIDENLMDEIYQFDFTKTNQVGRIKRTAYLGNQQIRFGSWGKDAVTRLYNRQTAQWNQSPVHESIEGLNGEEVISVWVKGNILHYTAKNMQEVIQKNNQYAKLAVQKYIARGKKSKWVHIYVSPLFNFMVEYFGYMGFLDGKAGLAIAKETARYTKLKYSLLKKYQSSKCPS